MWRWCLSSFHQFTSFSLCGMSTWRFIWASDRNHKSVSVSWTETVAVALFFLQTLSAQRCICALNLNFKKHPCHVIQWLNSQTGNSSQPTAALFLELEIVRCSFWPRIWRILTHFAQFNLMCGFIPCWFRSKRVFVRHTGCNERLRD